MNFYIISLLQQINNLSPTTYINNLIYIFFFLFKELIFISIPTAIPNSNTIFLFCKGLVIWIFQNIYLFLISKFQILYKSGYQILLFSRRNLELQRIFWYIHVIKLSIFLLIRQTFCQSYTMPANSTFYIIREIPFQTSSLNFPQRKTSLRKYLPLQTNNSSKQTVHTRQFHCRLSHDVQSLAKGPVLLHWFDIVFDEDEEGERDTFPHIST